jgi:hypothetical protein
MHNNPFFLLVNAPCDFLFSRWMWHSFAPFISSPPISLAFSDRTLLFSTLFILWIAALQVPSCACRGECEALARWNNVIFISATVNDSSAGEPPQNPADRHAWRAFRQLCINSSRRPISEGERGVRLSLFCLGASWTGAAVARITQACEAQLAQTGAPPGFALASPPGTATLQKWRVDSPGYSCHVHVPQQEMRASARILPAVHLVACWHQVQKRPAERGWPPLCCAAAVLQVCQPGFFIEEDRLVSNRNRFSENADQRPSTVSPHRA